MTDPTEPSEDQVLDLVPDFARAPEGEGEGGWTKLTDANPDYEKLWAMGPIDVPPPPPPPPAPPPMAPPPGPAPEAGEPTEPPAVTPGFTGTLVTGDEVLTASILVSPERLILWGGGHELGSWTHDQAKIARLTFSRFAIHAESDALTFTADDPSGLDNAISSSVPGNADPAEGDEGNAATEETPAALPETLPPPPPEPAPAEAELPLAPLPEPARPPEPTGLVTSRRPRIKTFKSGDDQPAEVAAHPTPAEQAISAAEARATDPGTAETDLGEVTTDFGESTIADTVKSRRAMTSVKARRFLPADIKDVAVKSGAVLILVGVLAGLGLLVLLLTRGGNDDTSVVSTASTAAPERVVITTAAPTTVPTTAPLPDTTLFQTDPETLRARWNQLAEVAAPNMILVEDIVSPFILLLAPNISLEGVLDPTVGSVVMRATPTGTPEGDAAILSALGILIGTADPTLDGNDRRALLGQLGLDVDRPELAGIDGSLTYNGLLYRMVYRQESNSLELAITPEGAPTTTTTN